MSAEDVKRQRLAKLAPWRHHQAEPPVKAEPRVKAEPASHDDAFYHSPDTAPEEPYWDHSAQQTTW